MLSRSLRFLIVVVLVLIVTSPPSHAWKFAVFSDSQGDGGTGDYNGVNYPVFTNIVNMLYSENVDFVIFQGDAVSGSTNDNLLGSEMDTWLTVMSTLHHPYYYTPGNHEQQTSTAMANVLRTKITNMPLNGPAGQEQMVYSFDHKGVHFVSLNSDQYGQQHHLQLAWLAQDLANCTQPLIFVKAHEPAYPCSSHTGSSLDAYPVERDKFWNMLTAAGANIYFCGHEHLYQRTLYGTVYQIISGGAGGPLVTGVPGTIAQHHYDVITINGNTISGVVKSDGGALLDSWSYTATPPIVATCSSARFLVNGAHASLKNKIVTCVSPSAIYVEEADRSAGFRVTGSISGIVTGDMVLTTGTVATNSSGERELQGAAMTVSSGNTLPKPLGMTDRCLIDGRIGDTPGTSGGVGCNTSSLLVRVFGKVTSVGTGAYAGYFYLDDGSGIEDGTAWNNIPNVGIRVYWPGTVLTGQYRVVTGVSSSFMNGTQVLKLVYSTDP